MISGKIHIGSHSGKALSHIRKTETFFERSRGLLGCKELVEGHGMLIAPCNSIHTFFMKIAIDVVFIGGDNRIIHMRQNMKPQRFALSGRASSVLELMAGQIHISNLRDGDQLLWEAS